MKKYIFSLISFIIGIACMMAFNIIGSEIAPDGMVVEPFYLIPIGFFFVFIAVISALIVTLFYKNKKCINN